MEVVDLNKARREREDDREDAAKAKEDALWALQHAIAKIEKDEWKPQAIYVALMLDGSRDDRRSITYAAAGLNSFEIKGLLAQHLHMQCDPTTTEEDYGNE